VSKLLPFIVIHDRIPLERRLRRRGEMGYKEGVDRKQIMLLPEAVEDYVEDDNPVQFIDAFVDSLDMTRLDFLHAEPEQTGRPPYDPRDLLKLYLYGYLNRVRSSRCLEREARRNVELIWLLKKLTPDFKTIAEFRKNNLQAIRDVSRQFSLLCRKCDLFGKQLVAIDGSKFRAVNGKKRHFTRAKLTRSLKEIDEKIDDYLRELDEHDKDETNTSPPTGEQVRAALAVLKDRKQRYETLARGLDETGRSEISLTDPDSRAMRTKQHVEPCYNVQTTVDARHKLILDHEVTNDPNDLHQLAPMAERAKELLDTEQLSVLADKGYYNTQQIKECVDSGITPYVAEREDKTARSERCVYDTERDCYTCPRGDALLPQAKVSMNGRMVIPYRARSCTGCPQRGCRRGIQPRVVYRWEHEQVLDEMRSRMTTDRLLYRTRQWLSEHPFGTIKHAMQQGYFLLKGLEKVRTEVSLSVLAYNMKRVLNIMGVQELRQVLA